MKRNFTPEGPDRSVGRGHITYVRTWEGWLYLSFVLDTYSRRVVGWSMANPISGPRAGARCAEHGDIYTHPPSATPWAHSSLRPWQPVRLGGVRQPPQKKRVCCPRWDLWLTPPTTTRWLRVSSRDNVKRELIHRHSWPNRQSATTAFLCRVHRRGLLQHYFRSRHSALGHF